MLRKYYEIYRMTLQKQPTNPLLCYERKMIRNIFARFFIN